MTLFREVGDKSGLARSFEALGSAAAVAGQFRRAACLFGAAEALLEAIGARLYPAERAAHDHDVATVRAGLGEEAFAAAAEGRSMTLEQAIAYALETSDSPECPKPIL